MKLLRRARILPGLLALGILTAAASEKPPINAPAGVALRGYDPVSYFDGGHPLRGEPSIRLRWNGAVWRFATEESRAKFEAHPERYAPQYGAYCAYAVSENYTADADPLAWTVVGDRLYVNYDLRVRAKWLEDRDERIADADRNWPGVLAK